MSTTVDERLLWSARLLRAGLTDAALLDEALAALLARHRAVEIDAAYSAYDEHRSASPVSTATSRRSAPLPRRRDTALPARSGGAGSPDVGPRPSWCSPGMPSLKRTRVALKRSRSQRAALADRA
jgi:hypothetical protein